MFICKRKFVKFIKSVLQYIHFDYPGKNKNYVYISEIIFSLINDGMFGKNDLHTNSAPHGSNIVPTPLCIVLVLRNKLRCPLVVITNVFFVIHVVFLIITKVLTS